MVAISILNAFTAQAPVSGAASLHAATAQLSSPFGALFQTQLKSADDAGKQPAPGKATDSAQAPSIATPAAPNVPQIAYPPVEFVAPTLAPFMQPPAAQAGRTASDDAPPQGQVPAPENLPLAASLELVAAPASVVLASHASFAGRLIPASPASPKSVAAAASEVSPPSSKAGVVPVKLVAVGSPVAIVPSANLILAASQAIVAPANVRASAPQTVVALADGHAWAAQAVVRLADVHAWAAQAVVRPADVHVWVPQPVIAPESSAPLASPILSAAATTKTPPALPILVADASRDEIMSREPVTAPVDSRGSSPDLSASTIMPAAYAAAQTVPDLAVAAPRQTDGPQIEGPQTEDLQTEDPDPVQTAIPNQSPTGKRGDPASTNAPQPGAKPVAPNTAGLSYGHALEDARAGLEFMKVQSAGGTKAPATPRNISDMAQQTTEAPIPDDATTKIGPKAQDGGAGAVPTAMTQAPAKTMSVGVATSLSHESPQLPAINGAQASADAVGSMKAQPKEAPSGSSGNDANAKPDHSSSAAAVVHTDGNGFGPAADVAGADPAAHGVPADPAIVAAAVPVPVEPRAANVGAKADASSSAPAADQALPATAAADQPVISGAQVTDHPGQTEIRIEMQAGSLGTVELRAHISGDQIGASIAVEHHDAQLMLTNDLPALHVALAEKNLRVNTLSISQGMGASMGGGQNGTAGQRGFSPSHPKAAYATQDEMSAPLREAAAESADAVLAGVGLSVLA